MRIHSLLDEFDDDADDQSADDACGCAVGGHLCFEFSDRYFYGSESIACFVEAIYDVMDFRCAVHILGLHPCDNGDCCECDDYSPSDDCNYNVWWFISVDGVDKVAVFAVHDVLLCCLARCIKYQFFYRRSRSS